MTTTIVMGRTDDGYVSATNSNYTTASNGPGAAKSVGNQSLYGQKFGGATYSLYQAALGFSLPATPADELVTAVQISVAHFSTLAVGTARSLQLRGYDWTGGGLVAADYRSRAQLQASALYGQADNVNGVDAKVIYSGHDSLLDLVQGGAGTTLLAFMTVSSRQVAGTTPTTDESDSIWSGNSSGTGSDPRLIYTSMPLHGHARTLGGVLQLSDGALAYLERDLSDPERIELHQRDSGGGHWTTTLPTGSAVTDFGGGVEGAQGFALAVDDLDAVYITGRNGANPNSISVKSYLRNPAGGWAVGSTMVTVASPSYSNGRLNNLAATWHPTAGGTLVVLASHTSGNALPGSSGNDTAYALFDATGVRNSTVTGARAIGSALGTLLPLRAPYSTDHNAFSNETGTGLDIVADRFNSEWGYVIGFAKGTRLAMNDQHALTRYILNGTGDGFTHTSSVNSSWGRKDANAKMRVVNVGAGQLATVTADGDTGWGIVVTVLQASGMTPGFVTLGQVVMDNEALAGFPVAGDVAASQAWDVVYSATDNKLLIYYVQSGTTGQVRETSIDLNTYQATMATRTIVDHSATAVTTYSLRTPRNAWATEDSWVLVSRNHPVDGVTNSEHRVTYNVAPSAPVLTPKSNFDATTATTFAWTFTDPNAGDTQSAFQLQIEDVADGSLDVDTGKVASATSSHNVTGGTLVNGKSYRWRVRTWDAADLEGPYSSYGTFSTSAGGAVTITDPATDNAGGVVTDDYLIKWSVTGTTQSSYRVILTRNDSGATVSDTGWVASSDTELLVGGMVSDVEHTVSVQVRNASLVPSGIGTRLITPSYATPEQPIITVTPVPEGGYVLIEVDNPVPGVPSAGGVEWAFEEAVMPGTWHHPDATWAVSAEQAHDGAQSGKLTVIGTPVAATVRSDSAAVTPGERYTSRFWAYRPVAGDAAVTIDWRTAADAPLSSVQNTVALAAGVWTLLTVTGTAPATAELARYGATLPGNPAAGTVLYADEMTFAEASDRPDVAHNTILRRPVGSGQGWTVVGQCGPDESFSDYTAPARIELEYMARGETA